MKMKRFLVEIEYITEHKYCSAKPLKVSITTRNIEWSMEQYQRNREPFNWKVINEEIV